MKIRINDYGIELESKPQQELPGDTLVTFVNDKGDRYRVQFNVQSDGIEINLSRAKGGDQLQIFPHSSNQIIVR